jgi:hypothetical protein
MASDGSGNLKKRPRVEDDLDLDDFGRKEPPPAPLALPGGYRDDANPFNDAQLSAPFKWKAKTDKMSKNGAAATMSEDQERAQREETLVRCTF